MADEKNYYEFIEDVVSLDASAHHKRRRPAKVWLVDRESGMRFGVTVVRHLGDALEIGFSSINPAPNLLIGEPQNPPAHAYEGRRPVTPGDHVLDMSTFDRRKRTATCSTCGPDTDVITGLRPGGVPIREEWHCPRGRDAMEVSTASTQSVTNSTIGGNVTQVRNVKGDVRL